MKCKKCGSEQKEGGRFCTVCGSPMSDERERNVQISTWQSKDMQENYTQPSRESQNKKKRNPLLVTGIVLASILVITTCIVICTYCFLIIDKAEKEDADQVTMQVENDEEQSDEEEKVAEQQEKQNDENEKEIVTQTPTEVPMIQKESVNVDITSVDNSEFPKVTLYFSVKDLENQYLDTINISQLTVYERQNGSSQDWKQVQTSLEDYGNQSDRKKSVAFVMDTSGSMEGSLESECAAADALLDRMEQESNYSVAFTAFSTEQHNWLDYTRDYSDFRAYMEELYADGETAFYDTLKNTLNHALYQDGQKYILAFTDGVDTNSYTTSQEVLEMSKAYKIPIYIITMSYVDYGYLSEVEEIAKNSGGGLYTIEAIEDLENIYYDIFELQRQQYSFTYESTQTSGYSDIRLQIVSEHYEGEAVESFYAEKPSYYYAKPEIAQVSASSECAPMTDSEQKKCTYGAENVCDGDNRTAWVEGEQGDGIGEYLTVQLKQEAAVKGIIISNGYYKNTDVYYRNNRIENVKLTFSDGSSKICKLEDNFLETCNISFDEPVVTSMIKIEILSVYKSMSLNGKKAYEDTCITELEIY